MSVLNVDSAGQKTDIAFLVFAPLKQRRANNSFDGNDNIGAKVIIDVLKRAGHKVGFCSADTAKEYRLVLVSFTSTWDMVAYYQTVALHPDWQPKQRKFKVLAGGFGMQNPTAIRNYVDFAAFGRAESYATEVIEKLLDGDVPTHRSIMHPPDLHEVWVEQAQSLYPYEVDGWKESFTGCPLKCKFCHYTFARKHKGSDDAYAKSEYVQTTLTGGGTPEVTWNQLLNWPKKAGRVRVAIDGFSERLRYIYGKRISNEDIVAGINQMGSYEGATTLLVYNISNMPGENEADRQSLYATLAEATPKYRLIFVLHSTPFRPSLLTPMQWEPVSLYPDNSKWSESVIVEDGHLRAVHSFTLESPWSHLQSVVVERATPEDDKAFHAICFAPKLHTGRSAEKLRRFAANFPVEKYLRRYNVDEPHPADFLNGYVSKDQMRKMARKLREQIDYSAAMPGWLPGKASIGKRNKLVAA